MILVVSSWFIGVLGCMFERRITRFLGYSGLVGLGFMSIGIIVKELLIMMLYVVSYSISIWVIWNIVVNKRKKLMNSLVELNSWEKGKLSMNLLSLIGILLLLGFLVKWNLIVLLIEKEWKVLGCLSLIVSVLGGYYYMRMLIVLIEEKRNFMKIVKKEEKKEIYEWIWVIGLLLVVIG